jgi:hypothetical protein
MRHWDTSRKVADSNPVVVIGSLHRYNHSDRTKTMWSNHSLTEINTRNGSWRVKTAGV